MKLKLIMYTFMLLIFISCKDNSNSNNNTSDKSDTLQIPIVPIHEGCYWEYENAQMASLSMYISTLEDKEWAISYFDTNNRIIHPTSVIRTRISTIGLPTTEYWGFAEKDSSILFGVTQHPLVEKYEKKAADFYFQILDLDYKLLHDTTIVNDTIIEKYNKTYRCCDSIVISDSYISSIDSIPSTWKIRYFANKTGDEVGAFLMEFELQEHFGFAVVNTFYINNFEIPIEDEEIDD